MPLNIAQTKILIWGASGVLTVGLGATVADFVLNLEEKQSTFDADNVRAVLEDVERVEVQKQELVAYTAVKRNFHELNWTGKVTVKPVEIKQDDVAEAKRTTVPVSDLVAVQMLQVDLSDPAGSSAYVTYKSRSAVPSASPEDEHLEVGESLPDPQGHIRVEAITVEGVVFAFEDSEREFEVVAPEVELEQGTMVVVGEGQVVHRVDDGAIPTSNAPAYRPEETTIIGRNRYRIGTEDAAFLAENWSATLSQDVRHSRHRDPRTGRYDGVEILEVRSGSLAERHGVQGGDVIKSINGHAVSSAQEAIHFAKTNADRYNTWEVEVENMGRTRTITYESPN
ncbi:MAG: PDZ domain-containing protein [Planctomycetota bacterium]|jgi:hypothetical protein|nr:hypothetical protein [Planctomycetota bacterium]MDP6368933.1 PDZ domain-containing protein [Planctomycetota bacterium]MDP6838173.1 PDZ domain-containing protein [Planctomycetota bacterium]MDP6956850.1 PDZ domain-containing protein [Planctomycetota bacterium]